MLEEQAGLSKQNLQNLRSLTGGTHDFSRVVKALQILDVDDEPIARSKQSSSYVVGRGNATGFDDSNDDDSDVDMFMDETEIHAFLYTVTQQDLNEDQAMSYLAEWTEKRRRTWSENKALKNARKKDRRHFEDPASRPRKPFSQKGKLNCQ